MENVFIISERDWKTSYSIKQLTQGARHVSVHECGRRGRWGHNRLGARLRPLRASLVYLLALTGILINHKAVCAVDSGWGLGGETAAIGKDTTVVEDIGEKGMNG